MSAPPSLSTSRLRHARTLVTAGALAAGSFALAVACGSSAPAPAQPKVISNGNEPDAGMANPQMLGLLGSMYGGDSYAFASLTGTGDIDSGFDDADIYGGLLGAGDAYGGGFGFGTSGFGYGGGGTGWGTIGNVRYGTIGHGSSTGYGTGYGTGGSGGIRGGAASVTVGNGASPATRDKEVIRRYVKGALAQIRSCYERRLLVEPTLAGKVSTEFTVDRDGNVTVQSVTGFDAEVDTCIETVIAGIAFPKPPGGGAVKVKYPFVFHSVD